MRLGAERDYELKLRRFEIDGFKSLNELDVAVPRDLMFLIGVNGAGKSTLLQALSFTRSFINHRIGEYYTERGWQPSDTRPRIALRTVRAPGRSAPLRLATPKNLQITYHLSCEQADIFWEFGWSHTANTVLNEKIWAKYAGEDKLTQIVNYARPSRSSSSDADTPLRIEDLRLPGSILSILPANRLAEGRDIEILNEVKHWADGIVSLELLSPAAMRRGIRGRPKDIGARGERLASFIAALPIAKRAELVKRVSQFYPIADLEAIRKNAGWIDMRILESYSNIARISPVHMSDGFMRILALCAIPEFDENVSIVLLDEVEDGIEPHILPELIKFISGASKCQFIMTSHSPYLVNFFDRDQVCFVARREDGQTIVAKSDEMDLFLKGADYFGVGEIWANASLETVSKAVRQTYELRSKSVRPEGEAERVSLFLEGK
ncbi:DNA replication and repair protein RecF [Methylorubrum thiocyanatum]|nr:DNA replication and repair protein RecF [Methylorubrum thiocyanatum]